MERQIVDGAAVMVTLRAVVHLPLVNLIRQWDAGYAV
jgi:hypothetical protein